jgi:hypothetical protein
MKPSEIFINSSPIIENNNNNNNNNSNNNTMDVDTMSIDQLKQELIQLRQQNIELLAIKKQKPRAKTLKHSTNQLLSTEQLHKQHEQHVQQQQQKKQRKTKRKQDGIIQQNPPKFHYNVKSNISNNNDTSKIILTRIK